jgi:hypothetical protein
MTSVKLRLIQPDDLDNGTNLLALVLSLSRVIGRRVDVTAIDMWRAKKAADQLLSALGLAVPEEYDRAADQYRDDMPPRGVPPRTNLDDTPGGAA